jgi:putative transcriptional regulator
VINAEREKANAPEAVLKEAGFIVSEECFSRPSCFDYAARKDEKIIFIKVQGDIDNFSPEDLDELKVISKCVSAASLLIGERTRKKPLEDDTVYWRHGVLAVTLKTFENTILRNVYPLIQARPGGYYVEIDCELVRRRRQELDLSIGEIAEMIGISRGAIYGYEQGMTKASVAAAYNLIYALGVPIAKPVDILDKAANQRKCFLAKAGHAIARNKLLQRILGKLNRCNITSVKKAPFDFVITVPEQKTKIIGAVANNKERELNRRVDEIVSVSRTVKAYPVLITEGQRSSYKNISCIRSEELSKIKNPEDLLRKLN